jgi:WD40 repeat protein
VLAQVQLGDILMVWSQAWSNDGRLLAVGTFTGTLFILDANTLAVRAKLIGAEPGAIDSISFSPDDQTVTTTGSAGEINFWSMPGLESEAHITLGPGVIGHDVVEAWYTATGQLVGIAPDLAHPNDLTTRVFGFAADPASLATEACKLGAGNLTKTEWHHDVGDQPYRTICP